MKDKIEMEAQRLLGITYLYPYQRLVIANILDALADYDSGREEKKPLLRQTVILPTGAGKSICFQLPALMDSGLTIIIYPLLGLMADQQRRLGDGVALVLKGGMSSDEKKALFTGLESGRVKLLLTNPEALQNPKTLEKLRKLKPRQLVIDEAHCVSEWGESFRPAYLKLGEVIRTLEPVCLTAFTATASPPILERVKEILFEGENSALISASSNRPAISYRVIPVLSMKRALVRSVVKMPKPLLIFVLSRDSAEIIAKELALCLPESEIRFYHAGLSKEERTGIEKWYMDADEGILVSTCAYGMGMDKNNIRTVIHAGLPASVEAYLQESGRAGRDRLAAASIVLMPFRQPEPESVRAKKMLEWASDRELCRRSGLLRLIGEEDAESLACMDEEGLGACDVCRGDVQILPEGFASIAASLWKNCWRFDQAVFKNILLGKIQAANTFPLPADWTEEELDEAIANGISASIIRKGKGPRKKMLAAGKSLFQSS